MLNFELKYFYFNWYKNIGHEGNQPELSTNSIHDNQISRVYVVIGGTQMYTKYE